MQSAGKSAIITGGSRGLGRSAVLSLAERGVNSIFTFQPGGGPFVENTSKALLPLMNDGGRIVMVLSWLTRVADPGSASYASMKGAVEVLASYLAQELGPRQIAVNTVAPGAIATDFSGGMVRDNLEINKRVAGNTALGRVGLPEDIGPMIASLLSEENRWINAQRIEVAGGMSI